MTFPNQRDSSFALSFLLLAVSIGIYSIYGLNCRLSRDTAIYMYAGQEMARGVPPYVSIFDVKGPVGPLSAGVLTMAAHQMGVDALYLSRVVYGLFGCMCTVVMYWLGRHLFRSEITALLSAFVFLTFAPFSHRAMIGLRPKVLAVLLVLLALLWTSRRRWFWAGAAGSLAALTWQPTGVYGLVTCIVAWRSSRKVRVRNLTRVGVGLLLPAIPICGYLAAKGAFWPMIQQSVIHVFSTRDPGDTLLLRVERIYHFVTTGYGVMLFPLVLSFGLVAAGYVWRIVRSGSVSRALLRDRFAPLLLTFPAPLLWTLNDFQGVADIFIFLPYVSLAFAKFLAMVLDSLAQKALSQKAALRRTALATQTMFLWLCGSLLVCSVMGALALKDTGLIAQKKHADRLIQQFGPDIRVFSLGQPEILVLLERTSPWPFTRMNPWVERHVQNRFPGGCERWLEEVKAYNPDVVAVGWTGGKYGEKALRWVAENYVLWKPSEYRWWVRREMGRRRDGETERWGDGGTERREQLAGAPGTHNQSVMTGEIRVPCLAESR